MGIEFKTAHNSKNEHETINLLKQAFDDYPELSQYTYSKLVLVDNTVQPPHSHPVITLNCRDNDSMPLLLSGYVHEQLHHYLHSVDEKLEQAVEELKARYTNVPVGFPEGANNEFWTYGHLILCSLEQMILRLVFGMDFAQISLKYWQNHHYTWIYKTVESDYKYLIETVKKYEMLPN